MEFASEMLVKATLLNLRVEEVPIDFKKDGRHRPPHLQTWHDGWRHLRFLLLYSPRWLFLYPGLSMTFFGMAVLLWLVPGPRLITRSVGLDVHTMLCAATMVILRYQLVLFGMFARVFASIERLNPKQSLSLDLFRIFTLEKGIAVGLIGSFLGMIPVILEVWNWAETDFGVQDYKTAMRLLIPGVTFVILGVQTVFGSFLLSLLALKRK